MLNVTNTEVFGWQAAIRGMRNPKNSWDKSDSGWHGEFIYATGMPIVDVGPNDLTLMKQLVAAGTDHSKFMRMIHVQCDWEAPLYWWKEADTYKVATVRNSCSTMHKITEHEFTFKDFACEHLERRSSLTLSRVIDDLNYYRDYYLSVKEQNVPGADAKAKEIWWQIIQLLPSSYLQKATMDLNYATLRNMYHSRNHHKQDEWREDFCNWVKTLPYSELITMTKDELLDSIKEE